VLRVTSPVFQSHRRALAVSAPHAEQRTRRRDLQTMAAPPIGI